MKGLNVRKLAAIAVGGALVGSALAPLAAAITLDKSKIINATTGTPIVNVVVGTNGAAVSDFVWAGNIAAKVAQLATIESDVTGGGTGTADPTDLSVDLAVGGSVIYGPDSSYTYYGTNYPLKSIEVTANKEFSFSNTAGPIGAISSGQLPFLTNTTKSYTYNGQTYQIAVKESIGINADARFDTDSTIKDLILYVKNAGDFNYVLDLGAGIPCWVDGGITKFIDGDSDNVLIPFLGSEYTVQECDLTSATKKIRLIKDSAKKTYTAGDEITGLTGKGKYAGQEMTIKITSLVSSSQTGTYYASFDLYDGNSNWVNSLPSTGEGVNLNELFRDSTGNLALETVVYVSTIRMATTPVNAAAVTIVVGKDAVTLADGKQFPYDSTQTDSTKYYWTTNFDANTLVNSSPAVATVKKITVKNNMTLWTKSGTPKGVWSTDDSLTIAGQDAAKAGGNVAHFLQGNKETDLGYDFVKLQFDGFKVDQALTTIKVGNNKITYKDSARITRAIPFYIQLANVANSSFTLDNQTFYYRCSSTDVNMLIIDQNYLNGAQVTISPVYDGNIACDAGSVDLNNGVTIVCDLNGVQYDLYGPNSTLAMPGAYLYADGNCEFSSAQLNDSIASFNDADYLQLGGAANYTKRSPSDGSVSFATKTVYYDDDKSARAPLTIPLYVTKSGGLMQDTYRYRMYVGGTVGSSDGPVYLVLDNTTAFSNEFSNADVTFYGSDASTSSPEGGLANVSYYWPDIADFGNSTGDNTYITAIFGMDVNGGGNDLNAYIDTATGKLVLLPNNQLSQPTSDVNFPGLTGTNWSLSVDTSISSYLQSAWVDYGSKVEIVDEKAAVLATIPQAQIYLSLTVLGKGATQVVSGGEKAAGVKKGDTATLGSTKVTVEDIKYAAGTCTIAGAKSSKIVKVGELVYPDSPEPAGSHIIVGGYFVNKLAEDVELASGLTLEETLTGSGDTVVELLGNGDIIVAGYTAVDTVDAAKELIDALDDLIA